MLMNSEQAPPSLNKSIDICRDFAITYRNPINPNSEEISSISNSRNSGTLVGQILFGFWPYRYFRQNSERYQMTSTLRPVYWLLTCIFLGPSQFAAADTCQDMERVALEFMNEYVSRSNQQLDVSATGAWFSSNPLISTSYREKITDLYLKADPEFGLEADPVLRAQDYPDDGFHLKSCDENEGAVILRGINWPSFNLRVLFGAGPDGLLIIDSYYIVDAIE
jgi:hypothetical protein